MLSVQEGIFGEILNRPMRNRSDGSPGAVFHADSESEIRLSLSLTERKFSRLELQEKRNF